MEKATSYCSHDDIMTHRIERELKDTPVPMTTEMFMTCYSCF